MLQGTVYVLLCMALSHTSMWRLHQPLVQMTVTPSVLNSM